MSRHNRNNFFAPILLAIFSASLGYQFEPKPTTIAVCKFEVNPHIKDSFPIISTENGIISPKYNHTDNSWWIEIPGNNAQDLTVICSGRDDQLGHLGTSYLAARCDENGILQTEQGALTADQLNCSVLASEKITITREGTCFGGHTNIHISLPEVSSTPFIEICHNENRSETLFTKHKINGPKLGEGVGITRPDFKPDVFYPNIDVDKCYTRDEQRRTVKEILKCTDDFAESYIQPLPSDLYLARGHLTPSADGIPADQKRATFYFVNAIPQWQIINSGNWLKLENQARFYAQREATILTVWTGAFGVTTLQDQEKIERSIFLGKTINSERPNVLPVPSVLYKVLVDEKNRRGIVVLQINNPHRNQTYAKDIICQDICNKIPWVLWDVTSFEYGYTYCCEVSDFSQRKPGILPNFGALELLI